MAKRLTSIRLPEITDRQLADLASATGLNTTELITTAIDRMHGKEIKTMQDNIRLYEDNAGGLYIANDEIAYNVTDVQVTSRFAVDAQAMLDGETDDWTVERVSVADLTNLTEIARYENGQVVVYYRTGSGQPVAGIAGRNYLRLDNIHDSKIEAVLDCISALKRGVQSPTIVRAEDGTYEYIPGAWLSDISYSGSRRVVMTVEPAHFGDELDIGEASDAELEDMAAWAADTWDWSIEE